MLNDLKWESLESRRENARLATMYKVVNGLVTVDTTEILVKSDTRTRKNNSLNYKHISTGCDQ